MKRVWRCLLVSHPVVGRIAGVEVSRAPQPAPIPEAYVKAKAALDALIGADQQAA